MARRAWLEHLRREAFNIPYFILTLSGWWVLNSKSKRKNVLYNIYSSLSIGSFLILFVNHIGDIYFLVQEERYKDIPASLYGSLLTYLVVTKTLLCRFKWRTITELRHNLASNLGVPGYGESLEDAAIIKNSADDMLGFTLLFGSLTVEVLFFWMAKPFLLSKKRTLPFVYRFPLDTTKTPVYECFIAYEMCSMTICTLNLMSMDQIIIGLIIQISAHYEVLTKNILNLGQGSLNNEIQDEYRSYDEYKRARFKQAVKSNIQHHQIILKYEDIILRFLQGPLLFHFVGVSLMACVTFLDIVETKEITLQTMHSMVYAGCVLFDTFTYCYYGTKLATKSDDLVEAIYEAPWLEADLDSQRALLLMKTIAFRAPQLNAALFQVDLPVFLSIMQMSYNMMAVMQGTVD